MKINYNVTGSERKKLVTAVSEILGMPAKYLGAPTFAYEVSGYHIDKTGTITGATGRYLIEALAERGFIGDIIEAPEIPIETEEHDGLTIEIPLTGFTPEKLDNLTKLVNAKAPLLKVALGTEDLPIQQTDATLRFPWFWPAAILTSEEIAAYTTLISLLCKTTKEKKRVTSKSKEVDGSPKYSMRCFLLSLGFIGDEYKTSRRILLSKLEGNSSWKNGAPPKTEVSSNE